MKKNHALILGLVGVAVVIGSILVMNTLNAANALPLTYTAMIKKANNLPEVKALLQRYPDAEMNYNENMTQDIDGRWVPANDGIGWVRYHVGGQRQQNLLELEAVINRTSGEVVQTRIQCNAGHYGQGIWESDPDKSFRYTSDDTDIAGFIDNDVTGLCNNQ
jgi:hypothetical protein